MVEVENILFYYSHIKRILWKSLRMYYASKSVNILSKKESVNIIQLLNEF